MSATEQVCESILIQAPASAVYRAISDVSQMARWSPELAHVSAPHEGPLEVGDRFAGYNRNGIQVWRTTSTVTLARPNRQFAIDVTAMGLPVARWSYRLVEHGDATELIETWSDLRAGPLGFAMKTMGFTATRVWDRATHNRAGITATLAAIKADLEAR